MSTSEGWTTTTDAEALAAWLDGFGRVLVVTHTKPDGDAIGSTLAVTRAINIKAKRAGVPGRVAVPCFAGVMPSWTESIVKNTKTLHEEQGLPDAKKFDAVLITDTGSWQQVDELSDLVRTLEPNAAIVDHHRQGDPDMAQRRLIETTAAAVVQPIARVCCAILGAESPADLPLEVAEPLYLGLATDTGWFRHSNVSPEVFTLAAQLLSVGVDHASLYERVQMQDRASRARLLGRALSNMEILDEGRVALLPLSVRDMHDCRAGPGDTGGLTDPALAIAGVRVAVALNEVHLGSDEGDTGPTNHVKLSLRSKAGEDFVDVSEIARQLGGGGHAQAAGARIEGTIAEARAKLLGALGIEA